MQEEQLCILCLTLVGGAVRRHGEKRMSILTSSIIARRFPSNEPHKGRLEAYL